MSAPRHHRAIWSAIDTIAADHDLSTSGLAIRAGLDSTTFNLSKRQKDGRLRWPSTESVSAALEATGLSFGEFAELVDADLDMPRADAGLYTVMAHSNISGQGA